MAFFAALIATLVALTPASIASWRAPGGLTDAALANATYPSTIDPSGTARFVGGHFVLTDPRTGCSMNELLLDVRGRGDFDSDGAQDAAVVLGAWPCSNGEDETLVAVHNDGGRPIVAATVRLGNREPIHWIQVQNAQILVRITEHGPLDPGCCAGVEALRTYALRGGRLDLVSDVRLN